MFLKQKTAFIDKDTIQTLIQHGLNIDDYKKFYNAKKLQEKITDTTILESTESQISTIELDTAEGKKHCIMIIDPKLEGKLGNTKIEKCQQAMEKGNISLHNGIIKIKDGGQDIRIFTNKVSKTKEGKFFVVFDNYGNHTELLHIKQTQQQVKILPVIDSLDISELDYSEIDVLGDN